LEAVSKQGLRKKYKKYYRYKYIIKPKIEEIEKIKNSLIGYEFYDIKVKFGGNKIYSNLNEEISFLSEFKRSKEDVVCSVRFIKDEGKYFIVKEEEIDFDFIEEDLICYT